MKSTDEQLEKRGYLINEAEQLFEEVSFEELLLWLSDAVPIKRTLAARRLGKILKSESIESLCYSLEKEKILYCKLEISNTLILFGKEAAPLLIQRLGKVANKQYKTPPKKKFGKKNYPLPHDLFARVLMKIGPDVLPELCEVLRSKDISKISEAIDAIGYICFYDAQEHHDVANLLQKCYQKHTDNILLKWKLLRAMSAFPQLLPLLEQQYPQLNNKELKQEAERSIEISRTNNKART